MIKNIAKANNKSNNTQNTEANNNGYDSTLGVIFHYDNGKWANSNYSLRVLVKI